MKKRRVSTNNEYVDIWTHNILVVNRKLPTGVEVEQIKKITT